MNPDNRNKRGRTSHLSKARLAEMIEEATVDAYGESEQTTGWFTMIDENLVVPFETTVLGVQVRVERIELDDSEHNNRGDLSTRTCASGDPDPRSTAANAAAGGRQLDRGLPRVAPRGAMMLRSPTGR